MEEEVADAFIESPVELSSHQFITNMKKARKISGCGPRGWRYEHLRVLISDSFTAENLFRVCSIIAAGLVTEAIKKLLRAARLIALPKSSGDVRPIAIGKVFRRITAKTICSQYKDSFSKFFTPLQHGIATDGGADLLVHHVQLLLDSHKDWVVMKTDAKNAFNSVKRSHLLTQVSNHFPEMFAHVNQMYAGFGALINLQGDSPVILSSEESIHQGDPLGPVSFATSIQELLTKLQNDHPCVVFLAYLDDVFLVGPSNNVMAIFEDLKLMFHDIGWTFWTPSVKFTTLHLSRSSHIHLFLSQQKEYLFWEFLLETKISCHMHVLLFAKHGENVCHQLPTLKTQEAMLLLRLCHLSRKFYLSRSVKTKACKLLQFFMIIYLALRFQIFYKFLTHNLAILPKDFCLEAFMRLGMAMPLPLLADEYESECGKRSIEKGIIC